jgi:predicted amidophosphoribosyltransferase
VPNRTRCRAHLEMANRLSQHIYATRVASGICISCTKPLDGNTRRCSTCCKRKSQDVAEKRRAEDALLSIGLGITERKRSAYPPNPYAESQRKRYHMLRKSGVCTQCGKNPSKATFSRCSECSQKKSQLKKKRIAYRREMLTMATHKLLEQVPDIVSSLPEDKNGTASSASNRDKQVCPYNLRSRKSCFS